MLKTLNDKLSAFCTFRRLIRITKMYPIITNLYIVICSVMVLAGFPIHDYLYTTLGYAIYPTMIFMVASVCFKFCLWHRVLLANMILTSICEFTVVNFQSLYDSLWYFVAIIGITTLAAIVSAITHYKHGCFKTTPKKIAR